MTLRLVAVAVCSVPFLASTAFAADLIESAPIIVDEAPTFDWEGFYVGAHGGGLVVNDTDSTYGIIGVQAGYNFLASESFLLGVELNASLLDGPGGQFYDYLVAGRAGALVTDSVLVYGIAALGLEGNEFNDDTRGIYGLGVGAELALADQFSVFGQVGVGGYTDGPEEEPHSTQATVGVNFHF